jgi:hypothetical protein
MIQTRIDHSAPLPACTRLKTCLFGFIVALCSLQVTAQSIQVVVPVISGYSNSRPAHFNWQFRSSGGGDAQVGQFACGSYWVAPADGDAGVEVLSLTGNPSWNDFVSCDADPITESHGLLDGSNGYGSYNAAENIIPNLPLTYTPALNSCVSLVAAMQRNEAETSDGGTRATVGEVVDAYCVVTILPSVPANNGADMIRPNVTGTYKEFLTWDDFDLSRLLTYDFLEGKSTSDWESVRVRWSHAIEVFGIFTEMKPGSWNKYSEGGRAFRSHIVVNEYGAGTAQSFNNDLLALLSSANTIEEKKPGLAAMLSYGLDIYHARYNYGSGKKKAWSSGAGQSVGTFVPPVLLASLLIDDEKANQLKMAAITNHDEDRALRGPQELRQATRGVTGVLVWGDGTPFVRSGNNMNTDDRAYWGRLVISGCFDGSINSCAPEGGSKTGADPYGYIDGPPNSPGYGYMSVASGGIRSFAAAMILVPSIREVVNSDDPIEYADRITRHGLWTFPDPVAIPSFEAQVNLCNIYSDPCPDFGITWGADPADVRFAIEDGTGRYVSRHGNNVSFGYEPSRSRDHWHEIIALYDGNTFEDNAVPLGTLVSPEVIFEYGASPKAHIRTPNVLAEIRYTVDGSEPSTGSSLYTAPVAVSAGTVVKAKAFQSGKTASNTRTKVFMAEAEGDVEQPSIAITSPMIGESVSDQITVTAEANDNVGVVGVQFIIDGTDFGVEDVAAPYSITWDTGIVQSGVHSITARARDAAGNLGHAISIPVTVGTSSTDTTPPSVPATPVASGVTPYSVYLDWAPSTDDSAVAGYKVYTNGGSPVSTSTNSANISGLSPQQTYSFTVSAYDYAENESAQSSAVSVTTTVAPASGGALMLDFGPTDPGQDQLTNSPGHVSGAVPMGETLWNVANPNASNLFYANGAPATGISMTLGSTPLDSKVVDFTASVSSSNALGSAHSTGIYAEGSVARDAVWNGSGSTSDYSMGIRTDGLGAGDYTVFVMAKNTNSGRSEMNIYAFSDSLRANYDYGGDTPVYIENNESSSWIEGDNYARVTVTVASGESIYIIVDGVGDGRERGFLNAVQIVAEGSQSGGRTWAGFPVDDNGFVNTGAYLGWISFVDENSPWAWSHALGSWIYAPDPGSEANGVWVYKL